MNKNTIKRRQLIKGTAWSMPVLVGSMSAANGQGAPSRYGVWRNYSAIDIPAYAASVCDNNMKLIETTNIPTFTSYQDALDSGFFTGLPTLQQIQDDITNNKVVKGSNAYNTAPYLYGTYGTWVPETNQYQVSFKRTFLVDTGTMSSISLTTITLNGLDRSADLYMNTYYIYPDNIQISLNHEITSPNWIPDLNTNQKEYNYSGDANKQLVTMTTTTDLILKKNEANNTFSVVVPNQAYSYGLEVITHGVACSPGKVPFNDTGDFIIPTDIPVPAGW